MSDNQAILCAQDDGTLCFGDYTLPEKQKLDHFIFQGDTYKVKTSEELTKLEKNGLFVYESVPGSTVTEYRSTPDEVSFWVSSFEDVQFTLELEPDQEYLVVVDGVSIGAMMTNLSGKLSVSVELGEDEVIPVKIKKVS